MNELLGGYAPINRAFRRVKKNFLISETIRKLLLILLWWLGLGKKKNPYCQKYILKYLQWNVMIDIDFTIKYFNKKVDETIWQLLLNLVMCIF